MGAGSGAPVSGFDRSGVEMIKLGLQYYICGRNAARTGFLPVAGNLLHHAIEMLLKAQLLKTYSLQQIKSNYLHNLTKAWSDFKTSLPSENLDQFDQTIADLDVFDRIRYPDEVVKKGASMAISWGGPKPAVSTMIGPQVPEYFLYVNDVDDLVHTIFRVCSLNPKFFAWTTLRDEARRSLEYQNLHAPYFLGGE